MYERSTEPKETNRQIGPMFHQWLQEGALGVIPVDAATFTQNDNDAILSGSDTFLAQFAKDHLSYRGSKGLDFVARFNGKYVIGEAKFLTDFGGHQNAQFNDAVALLKSKSSAAKVALLDGVLYIQGNNSMHRRITSTYKNNNIMSALVLRDFIYSL